LRRGSQRGRCTARALRFEDALDPAEALGDVVTGQLDVHSSRPACLGLVNSEEPLDLSEHVIEVACLVAGSLAKVLPCIGSQTQATGWPAADTARTSGGKALRTLSTPIRVTKVSRPGARSAFSRSQRRYRLVRGCSRPELDFDRFPIPAANSTWAPSISRVRSSDPEEVGRAVVPAHP